MSSKRRLFFALEPPQRVREEIHVIQQQLNGVGRAIPPHQFHITLAFLGSQEPALIPDLCQLAANLAFAPCTLVLDTTGIFLRSEILWLGAKQPPEALIGFRNTLALGLDKAGIQIDRKRWKLHITLYRRLRIQPPIMETVPVNWHLNEFSLVESVSVKSGVEYQQLACWKIN